MWPYWTPFGNGHCSGKVKVKGKKPSMKNLIPVGQAVNTKRKEKKETASGKSVSLNVISSKLYPTDPNCACQILSQSSQCLYTNRKIDR